MGLLVVSNRIKIQALMLITVKMLMFPEGTTTNGRALIKFKPGKSSTLGCFSTYSLPNTGRDRSWFLTFRRLSCWGPGPACSAALPQQAGEFSGIAADIRPSVVTGHVA